MPSGLLIKQRPGSEELVVSSTSRPIISARCKFSIYAHMKTRHVVKILLLLTVAAILVSYVALRIKVNKTIRDKTRLVKQYLISAREMENQSRNSGSCASYAVRADVLKKKYLDEHIFQQYLWDRISERLLRDPQVEKKLVPIGGGRMVDAYYYNDTGFVRISREQPQEYERSIEASEHSISY